jgi:acyl carrier protein
LTNQGSRISAQEELLALIASWDVEMDGPIDTDTPLIASGLFDSLALFNLVVWIEQRVGAPIDPTAVDLATEWDTVDAIVRFIDRRRNRGRDR